MNIAIFNFAFLGLVLHVQQGTARRRHHVTHRNETGERTGPTKK